MNFHTKKVIKTIQSLVKDTNIYIKNGNENKFVTESVAKFVSYILRILGIGGNTDQLMESAQGTETKVAPFIDTIVDLRNQIRKVGFSREELKKSVLLELSDNLRDNILPLLGVKLDDMDKEKTEWKFQDMETLLKERMANIDLTEKRKADRLINLQKKKAEEEEKRVPPSEYFITKSKKNEKGPIYSEFEDDGFPKLDSAGKPISKGLSKKLQKELETHKKKHEAWKAGLETFYNVGKGWFVRKSILKAVLEQTLGGKGEPSSELRGLLRPDSEEEKVQEGNAEFFREDETVFSPTPGQWLRIFQIDQMEML